MKYIIITFDFEGKWGMPHKSQYDLVETTHRLLDVLDRYCIKAVFFVVGKIIEEYPDLIKEMAKQGHEIAIHGYAHEHLDRLNEVELATFSDNLYHVENLLEKLTDKRPSGFRSPYMMAPRFYTPDLYRILEAHGYKWVSNRELRFSEELFRPDRLRFPFLWGRNNWCTEILFLMLNMGLIMKENIGNESGFRRIIANLRWLNGVKPFRRGNLMEIPVYSPLDCDLLGLPTPEEATSDEWIRYAVDCLIGGANRRGTFYMLNFHDWIIGTANRTQVLDKVLYNFTKNRDITFITSLITKL